MRMEGLKKDRKPWASTLFALKGNFQIAELSSQDACQWSDKAEDLRNFICASEDMYPGINRWFEDKVIPGLRCAERIAYVGYENEQTIASAVLKIGKRSKLCHLKIHEDFQDSHLGQMFLTQITSAILPHADELYFTLPESLWTQKAYFFRSFGFSFAGRSPRQYRLGNTELFCTASVASVWQAALEKLPNLIKRFSLAGRSIENDVLLSVKAQHADKILSGKKSVEIRKRFSKNWTGSRVAIYASLPTGALVGEATISAVTCATPDEVWTRFGSEIGSSLEDFQTYTSSCELVAAIELKDVVAYRKPISRKEASTFLGRNLIPPQSYCKLGVANAIFWTKAVSIASFLEKGPSR